MTTLQVRVPAAVQTPRGAVAAAAVAVPLLRFAASVTAVVLASARGRAAPAAASVWPD